MPSLQFGVQTLVADRSNGSLQRTMDLLSAVDAMRRRLGCQEMKINPMIPPAELAVGWLTMYLIGTELFVFSPLLPTLAVNYDVSSKVVGLCVTTFSLAYMISAPLFGYVADRVGKRRVLICCLLAFGTANLLTASAVNFPWLLALRLFAGLQRRGSRHRSTRWSMTPLRRIAAPLG